jgi:hypothetical protein
VRHPRRRFRATVAILLLLPVPAGAQSVFLRILPRPGDFFRTRMDQQIDMSGTSRVRGEDSTIAVASATHVLSHSTVERSDPERGTVVVAVTDSISVVSSDGEVIRTAEETRRLMQGKRVRLRIATDGATELLDDPAAEDRPEVRSAFEPMPATLPRGRVSVGDSWTRRLAVPLGGGVRRPEQGGEGAAAGSNPTTIVATFRLDSLTGASEKAYISLHGAVTRDADAEGLPPGTKFVTTGVVSGSMVVDLKRGWVVDSRTTMTLKSTVTLPGGDTPPMRMTMKMSQWMRLVK